MTMNNSSVALFCPLNTGASKMINCATLNCHGLSADMRSSKVPMLFQELGRMHVIFLQETNLNTLQKVEAFNRIFEPSFWVFHEKPTNQQSGVSVLINRSVPATDFHPTSLVDGRALLVSFGIGKKRFGIMSVYAPAASTQRSGFFKSLHNRLRLLNLMYEGYLFAGDFNCIADPEMDRTSVRASENRNIRIGYADWQKTCHMLHLVDVFREKHPNQSLFTRSTTSNGSETGRSRIDMIFGSRNFASSMAEVSSYAVNISDHCVFTAKFTESALFLERGSGFWRANSQLIESRAAFDECECILFAFLFRYRLWRREQLPATTAAEAAAVLTEWDRTKAKVRDCLDKASRKAVRDRRSKISYLNERKVRLEAFPLEALMLTHQNELEQVKLQLQQVDKQSIAMCIFRSALKEEAHDNYTLQSAKRLERANGASKHIFYLNNSPNAAVSGGKEVLHCAKRWYEEKYSPRQVQRDKWDHFLRGVPQVSEDKRDSVEGEIALREISDAIDSLNKGKSPGPDGLPNEFYMLHKETISRCLFAVFRASFSSKRLPDSQYEAIISLLYKGKGDRGDLGNWRPLSLLNSDYKILSKVLSVRLKSTLADVISFEQSSSVPGRSIQEANLQVYNAIEDCSQDANDPEVLYSVDQKAAFDVVDWDYINAVLTVMRFGPDFINWVGILYKVGCVKSRLCINGHLSDAFNLYRGVRQGCPLSPDLYVLAIEPVFANIRADSLISGFTVGEQTNKSVDFADDANILCSDTKAVDNHFDEYGACSGASIRADKCQTLKLTTNRQEMGSIKLFGLYYGTGEEKNWEAVLKRFDDLQKGRPPPDLSLIGRVRLVQTYYLSQLWYKTWTLRPSDQQIRKIQKACKVYILGNLEIGLSRVAMLPVNKGGLGLPDIELKIMAQRVWWFIRRVTDVKPAIWHQSFDRFFRLVENKSLRQLPRKEHIPTFYRVLAKALHMLELRTSGGCFYLRNVAVGADKWGCKDVYNKLVGVRYADTITKMTSVYDLQKPRFGLSTIAPLGPYYKDIHFRMLCKKLYTRDKMTEVDAGGDRTCREGCGEIETHEHVFLDCQGAMDAWDFLQRRLRALDPGLVLNKEARLCGFVPSNRKRWLASWLVAVMKAAIWTRRANLTKNRSSRSILAIFARQLQNQLLKAYIIGPEERFFRLFCNVEEMCKLEDGQVSMPGWLNRLLANNMDD
jgi:exonuclease III